MRARRGRLDAGKELVEREREKARRKKGLAEPARFDCV